MAIAIVAAVLAVVIIILVYILGKEDVGAGVIVVISLIVKWVIFGGWYFILEKDVFGLMKSEDTYVSEETFSEDPFEKATEIFFNPNADNYFGLSDDMISSYAGIDFDEETANYVKDQKYYYFIGETTSILGDKIIFDEPIPVTLEVSFNDNRKLKKIEYIIGTFPEMGISYVFENEETKNIMTSVHSAIESNISGNFKLNDSSIFVDEISSTKCAVYSSYGAYDEFNDERLLGNTIYIDFYGK